VGGVPARVPAEKLDARFIKRLFIISPWQVSRASVRSLADGPGEDPVADLATLANIAEILGALTIVGGVVFALFQIREFRTQRREAVAVELIRSFHDPQLAHAVNLIRELPDGVSAEELRSRGPEYERAAVMVSTTYEAIALLVFRRMASFSLARDLTGGLAVVMWRKLARWMDVVRQEQAQPSWAEWFQWLAEQLARDAERKEAHPAYEKFADWRPREK
jgi:hypothetical protein